MASTDLYAALEIGQTFSKLVVGHFQKGQLNVCGAFITPTRGFSNKKISDRRLLLATLQFLFAETTKQQLSFSELILILPAIDLAIYRRKAQYLVPSKDRVITTNDIEVILHAVGKNDIPKGLLAVDINPIQYTLDTNRVIRDNPVGMTATSLQVEAIVSVMPQELAIQLADIAAEAGFNVSSVIPTPFAGMYANCTRNELEEGIMVLDIGGSQTTLSMIKHQQIIFYKTIDLGGFHITKDLAEVLKISFDDAEQLKRFAGNALANQTSEIVVYNGSSNPAKITEHQVVEIIEARLDDIIDEMTAALKSSTVKETFPLVLTGGTANLTNLPVKFTQSTGIPCRMGIPTVIGARQGEFSATVGALISYMINTLKQSDETLITMSRP